MLKKAGDFFFRETIFTQIPIDVHEVKEKLAAMLWKNKKILIAATVILPVAYVADVWLLGSASAALYDFAVNIKHSTRAILAGKQASEVNNLSWYMGHPLSVSWTWMTKTDAELSVPAIRTVWLYANGGILIPTLVMYTRNKWLRELHANKNDARHVHGLKVVDNPAYGTTRWAGPDDVAHFCEFGPPRKGSGGVVLGELDNKILRIIPGKNTRKGELGLTGHVVGYGVTGSGKSYTFVRNNIIAGVEDGQSLVIIDPKGELLETMGKWLESREYDVRIFNLVNPECSHQWNPIMECSNDEEIAEMASCMIENAAKDTSGYFMNKEIQLFEALSGLLKDAFPPEQAHPRSVLSLASWSKEKLEQVFSSAYRDKKISATIYERWRGTASANLEEAKSGLTAKLKIITTRSLAALMSGHEIDLAAIGKKKTALFCILPIKGSEVLKPILSVFYMFLFNRLYELAANNGGRLPVDVRCIFDEVANIGKIPGFSEKISTARSLGILLQYILQGRSQLNDVYGIEGARNILASTPISLLLGVAPDDEVTKDLFSNKLGEAAVKIKQHRKDVTTPLETLELAKKTETIGKRKLMEKYEIKEMNTKFCIADVQASKPMFMRKLGWVELPQAVEIKKCGTRPVSEYIPPRTLDIELPATEVYGDGAVAAGAGSLFWDIKKDHAKGGNQGAAAMRKNILDTDLEESQQEAAKQSNTQETPHTEQSESDIRTDNVKEEKQPENIEINEDESPRVESDDTDTQGFNVSSPIF